LKPQYRTVRQGQRHLSHNQRNDALLLLLVVVVVALRPLRCTAEALLQVLLPTSNHEPALRRLHHNPT